MKSPIRIGIDPRPSAGPADDAVPVSFIVPTFNAARTLEACVAAIREGAPAGAEVIVVDDGSLDDTVTVARRLADVVIARPCQGGAARARNDGAAAARGSLLFFVDADVVANSPAIMGALTRIADGADAVFGAYQPMPPADFRNLPTTYKNLLHHWTHLRGSGVAGTFWSGFGAVRREAFFTARGFDPAVTTSADVEDIHLGYRLRAAGFRIVLDASLQVAHHKGYTVRSMIASDVFHRAIPWVRAMLELRTFQRDLNLRRGAMSGALLAYSAPACFAAAPFFGTPLVAAGGALLVAWLVLNRDFFTFARRTSGAAGAIASVGFVYLYYVYGPIGVLLGGATYLLRHDHRSFLNRLRLDGEQGTEPELPLSVAVVVSPGEQPSALEGLPDPGPGWELLVVSEKMPDKLPPAARFIRAPAGAERNEMRGLALDACRGEMLATLDGNCVPAEGWLERVRAAAERSELVVGGAFEHDRRNPLARAYQIARYWAWRPQRPAAWLVDHPSTNAAFRTAVARQLGGFSEGGALVLRIAGFGARPVRFDPTMSVRLTGRPGVVPLTRGLAGVARLRAAASCRYFDVKALHRLVIVTAAPFVAAAGVGRVVRRALNEGWADSSFWAALPLVAVGFAFHALGRMVGMIRPGARGGVVPRAEEDVAALDRSFTAAGGR